MSGAEELFNRISPEEEVNWHVVQLIMEGYAERYPEELVGCIELVKKMRAEKTNSYALSDKGGSEMRHVYEIPSSLGNALKIKYPKIFDGKNLRQFLKLYPIFQIAEKI